MPKENQNKTTNNKYATLCLPNCLSYREVAENLKKTYNVSMTQAGISNAYFTSLTKIVIELAKLNGYRLTTSQAKILVKQQNFQNLIGELIINSYEG